MRNKGVMLSVRKKYPSESFLLDAMSSEEFSKYTSYICTAGIEDAKSPMEWLENRELMSFVEIAKSLNLTPKEVKEAYESGMDKLRKLCGVKNKLKIKKRKKRKKKIKKLGGLFDYPVN